MERITFQNKGNTVVGNLFKPEGFEQGTRYPAVVVTHPFGAVKEQLPSTYAKLLAAEGFITLVFDASYQGAGPGLTDLEPVSGFESLTRRPRAYRDDVMIGLSSHQSTSMTT